MKRSVKLHFDHGSKKNNPGKKRWFKELEEAVAAWHANRTKRFAACVGSKTELSEVYKFLIEHKVPVKAYSGDTNESAKFEDLQDADTAWIDFGCVAATTSLSIGVDPKEVEFDRVFMWTHPQGCMLLAMFQAAMRFGRQAAHPLGNKVVCMLVKCMPPGERAKQVRLGKKKPIVNPTYEAEYKRLVKRLSTTTAPSCSASDITDGSSSQSRQQRGERHSATTMTIWMRLRRTRTTTSLWGAQRSKSGRS